MYMKTVLTKVHYSGVTNGSNTSESVEISLPLWGKSLPPLLNHPTMLFFLYHLIFWCEKNFDVVDVCYSHGSQTSGTSYQLNIFLLDLFSTCTFWIDIVQADPCLMFSVTEFHFSDLMAIVSAVRFSKLTVQIQCPLRKLWLDISLYLWELIICVRKEKSFAHFTYLFVVKFKGRTISDWCICSGEMPIVNRCKYVDVWFQNCVVIGTLLLIMFVIIIAWQRRCISLKLGIDNMCMVSVTNTFRYNARNMLMRSNYYHKGELG